MYEPDLYILNAVMYTCAGNQCEQGVGVCPPISKLEASIQFWLLKFAYWVCVQKLSSLLHLLHDFSWPIISFTWLYHTNCQWECHVLVRDFSLLYRLWCDVIRTFSQMSAHRSLGKSLDIRFFYVLDITFQNSRMISFKQSILVVAMWCNSLLPEYWN